MRILFLSNWFPYPPTNGAKIRIYNLIRELAADHEISLVAYARTFSIDEVQRQLPALSRYTKVIKVIPAKRFEGQSAPTRGWLSPLPRSVVQTYSREMEDIVLSEASSGRYDMVVASEVGPPGSVSLLANSIKGIPVILDAIEVAVIKEEYEGERRFLRRLRRGLAWMKSSRLTRETICRVAAVTVPSIQEFEYIRGIVGNEAVLEVIPHGVGMKLLGRPLQVARQNQIVFTGSLTYGPNADAVIHFLDEISLVSG